MPEQTERHALARFGLALDVSDDNSVGVLLVEHDVE